MPYLNWKTEKLECLFERESEGEPALKGSAPLSAPTSDSMGFVPLEPFSRVKLQLCLGFHLRDLLMEALRGPLLACQGELRLDCPFGWTLFWKIRQGEESRFLVAHPEQGQYVATLAFQTEDAAGFLKKLEGSLESDRLILSELVQALGSSSNFDLELIWRNG